MWKASVQGMRRWVDIVWGDPGDVVTVMDGGG